MEPIFSLPLCITIFFIVTALFKRARFSAVVGMLAAGIILGLPLLKDELLLPNSGLFQALGEAGLLAIMFVAGLEVSWSMMFREKRQAATLAVVDSLTPFLLALLVFLALGFPLPVSLFLGVCMGITAEATKAKVLMEAGKLKTKLGALMMGAGILDDMLGMGLFVILGYIFHTALPVREMVMLSAMIMAFFLGVVVHSEIGRAKAAIPWMEKACMYVLAPFFFITMGLNFSLESLIIEPMLLVLVIAVAFAGKMLGALITKPVMGLGFAKLHLVGWAMNCRGAVELALAFIAFKAGIFSVSVYSSLVVMALVTTVAFPLVFPYLLRKSPRIMD